MLNSQVEYTVTTDTDIEYDYNKVLTITDLDASYIDRLDTCEVKLNACDSSNKSKAALYLSRNAFQTDAVLLYADDIVALLYIFIYIYNNTDIKRIKVAPHSKEDIGKYASLATPESVYRCYNDKRFNYVLIDVKEVESRIGPLLKRNGLL